MYTNEDDIQKEFNPSFLTNVVLVDLTVDQLSFINAATKKNKKK